MRVCIGGTFNVLHKGHKKLIDVALETAGRQGYVFIGVTTGDLLKDKTKVKSFEQRKQILETYLSQKKFNGTVVIQPIHDVFGPTLEEEFDSIIVSPETIPGAQKINERRIQQGKKPLHIVQIPFVLAEDGRPISTTRIQHHEIDENGRLLLKD